MRSLHRGRFLEDGVALVLLRCCWCAIVVRYYTGMIVMDHERTYSRECVCENATRQQSE